MEPRFLHHDLRLVEPLFGDPLTDLIIELDGLRTKRLSGTTHPRIFFQLKHIFHTLESIGSARIEGNRTTVAEYIETKLEGKPSSLPSIREIQNSEKAMAFVDENVKDHKTDRAFVSELHKIVVDGLEPPPKGEGDSTPGVYSKGIRRISGSSHLPPDAMQIERYMNDLYEFIDRKVTPKYDLLKTAIAHHRFVWIHPFSNGNGRTVRVFTYAMLVKQGFQVERGRILNPTAVFCSDRNVYNEHLTQADQGSQEGILAWCQYVLRGLKAEIEKIERLLKHEFLKSKILLPALDISFQRKLVTDIELQILKRAVEKQVLRASDIKDLFPGKHPVEVSRNIKRLVNNKMLVPETQNARKYVIRFDNNYLLRGIIKMLDEEGFLPLKGEST